jgi:hypothetical protein
MDDDWEMMAQAQAQNQENDWEAEYEAEMEIEAEMGSDTSGAPAGNARPNSKSGSSGSSSTIVQESAPIDFDKEFAPIPSYMDKPGKPSHFRFTVSIGLIVCSATSESSQIKETSVCRGPSDRLYS